MLSKLASTTLLAGLLAGCAAPYSPSPVASNFPNTAQPKLQAAAHWGVIADHLEKRLVEDMKRGPQRPFFLHENPQATPFQRALTTQIISSLVRDGYVVSRAPAGALRIDLDVQALTFTADRPQQRPMFSKARLSNEVWVDTEYNPGGIDRSMFAPGETPRTELIITVSVSDQYRYYARSTSAYYVTDGDRSLYGIRDEAPANAPQLTTAFKVRGDR